MESRELEMKVETERLRSEEEKAGVAKEVAYEEYKKALREANRQNMPKVKKK